MKFRFPLHIHLSTLFVLMTLIVSGAIATIGYRMSYNMLEASAEDLTQRARNRAALGHRFAQGGAMPFPGRVERHGQDDDDEERDDEAEGTFGHGVRVCVGRRVEGGWSCISKS